MNARRLLLPFLLLAACGESAKGIDAAIGPDLGASPLLTASWRRLDNGPHINGKQDDLYFIDARNGWSVNGDGNIFHTTDGGETWTQQLAKPGTYFRAIVFADAQNGYASNIGTDYYPQVTDPTPLYATHDGGATWAPVTSFNGPTPKGICNFYRIDAQHLIGTGRVGGPTFLIRSSDGGATWTSIDLGPHIAMLVDSYFTDFDHGFITGGSATTASSACTILRTADGGATWDEVFTSDDTGTMCWKMSFPSPQVGYAAVLTFGNTTSSFVKTTDGGATWQSMPFTGDVYGGLGVGFLTDQVGWIGGESGGRPAYRTDDGGATWNPDPSLGPFINRFRFVDGVGYAIGSYIYKLSAP